MNDKTTDVHPLAQRLNDEMLEALDEELELELDDDRLDAAVEHITGRQPKETIDRDTYFRELLRLQRELIRLQDWVVHQKLKLVVLFEGRDAAGKGGVIKRVTPAAEPAHLQSCGAARAHRARTLSVVFSALHGPSAGGRGNRAVRPQLVQPGRRRTGNRILL